MVAELPKVMSTFVALYTASVLIQLFVIRSSENTHRRQDFNQAALDDPLCPFLSGRLSARLQGQTEEDLGVIVSDPSAHERSLQSRPYITLRHFVPASPTSLPCTTCE